MRALFESGEFVLHSGERSNFRIECDALTDADLTTLAQMLVARLPAFGAVEGVPRGGLRLAAALVPFVTRGPLLIVDDVYTTGTSVRAHRGDREAIGAVLFSRNPVTEDWIYPLFTLGGAWKREGRKEKEST